MNESLKTIGIILARGGSKRIPRKNVKELGGKPLIAYTIEAAHKAQTLERVILSTDDAEIAEVARAFGCEVPFMRPAELGADDVVDYPVILHALAWLKEHEAYVPDIVVQLRPTSPLRTEKDIDDAVQLLSKHPEADSVRTVTEPEQSPYKMYGIDEEGYLAPLLPVPGHAESFNLLSAQLPKAYKHVGYVDAVWHRTLVAKGKMTGDKILPLVLPHAYSGINTPEDWEHYEYLMQHKT